MLKSEKMTAQGNIKFLNIIKINIFFTVSTQVG